MFKSTYVYIMLVTNEVVVNWPTWLIFIDIILTIKILFTVNSLKKTIPSKHYVQFFSFKKITLNFD